MDDRDTDCLGGGQLRETVFLNHAKLDVYPLEVRPLAQHEGSGFLVTYPDFDDKVRVLNANPQIKNRIASMLAVVQDAAGAVTIPRQSRWLSFNVSSRPTVETKYPLAQKLWPTKFLLCSPYTRAK